MFALVALLHLAAPEAQASSIGLEPQNRVHAGLSMVDGPSPVGFSLGFDSRLTRLVAMDVGAFFSPFSVPDDYESVVDNYPQNFHLRHGVYFMPGFRIPHPQPKSWAWEAFVRVGAGVLWAANLDPYVANSPTSVRPGAGGTVGLDAHARFGNYGLRAYGRGWIFGGQRAAPDETYALVRPHWGVEAVYQW